MMKSIWLAAIGCLCFASSYAQLGHYIDSSGKKRTMMFPRHVFHKDAVFRGARFPARTDINHGHFLGAADCSGAVFARHCDLNHARFDQPVTFENTTFEDVADLNHCTFAAAAAFNSAIFRSFADFNHVSFAGPADFTNARFDSTLDFDHVVFKGTLKLNRLNGSHTRFIFSEATLPDTIQLCFDSALTTYIDLTAAKPDTGKIHYIMLTGTNIAMLHIDYRQFQLIFPPQTDIMAVKATYQALLDNFSKHNDTPGYQKLKQEYDLKFH